MTRAYVGLGTNLGDRQGHLERALALLGARSGIRLIRISSLYETEPVDVAGGWFFNCVAEVETALGARELLGALLEIEAACGRPRLRQRGEARVVDVDLLLYGSQRIAEPDLEVPHPRMHLRRFVLAPLAELDAGVTHPGLGISIGELLRRLPPVPAARVVGRDWISTRLEGRPVP